MDFLWYFRNRSQTSERMEAMLHQILPINPGGSWSRSRLANDEPESYI